MGGGGVGEGMGEIINAPAMFLNRKWKRNGASFKIYQILKREKDLLNVSAELNTENSTCLISTCSFIYRKPHRVTVYVKCQNSD